MSIVPTIEKKKLNFTSFINKAYTEGVYADTPQNRKLGRVGMSYSEYANKIKVENKQEENFDKNKEKLSITNVSISNKWIYDTYKGGLEVIAKINGKQVKFPFSMVGVSIKDVGMDCNYAIIDNKRVKICKDNTGGFKKFELNIPSSILMSQPKENQKDFSFTGRFYSTKPIVNFFKEKLQKIMEENKFSEEFLKAFSITDPKLKLDKERVASVKEIIKKSEYISKLTEKELDDIIKFSDIKVIDDDVYNKRQALASDYKKKLSEGNDIKYSADEEVSLIDEMIEEALEETGHRFKD